jgi:superfamily II DNA or RNA helicase
MNFRFPPIYSLRVRVNGNPVYRLSEPERACQVHMINFVADGTKGFILVEDDKKETLVTLTGAEPPERFERVLRVKNLRDSLGSGVLSDPNCEKVWVRPAELVDSSDALADWEGKCGATCDSWADQFAPRCEVKDEQNKMLHRGLRPPQVGAIYKTLGHWTTTDDPATIVMPTGTGKTEAMLALLVAGRCQKLLVVVPTDPLRDQTAAKFINFGVLKEFGVVGLGALYPAVGVLRHRPRSTNEVDELFRLCNVVVTTMSVAGGCGAWAQQRMAELCSHLFIDEAHHIPAPTWDGFRRYFQDRRVVQFTATPFRSDGKHVDGEIIHNYPLLKAQQEDYFRQINFMPVCEFDEDRADAMIAEKAVAQLKADLSSGYDHILMARVSDIERTKVVYPLYERHTDLNAVVIHSRLGAREKRETLRKIKAKEVRIVVCVDMLGEGFDLPELKIAAVHVVHKSLGVTLQFIGRFTRAKENIGDATFIANTADPRVQECVESLYGEDPDWNQILRDLSSGAIREQIETAKFNAGFRSPGSKLNMRNVRPAMSTVVYRTKGASWKPEKFRDALTEDVEVLPPEINRERNVLVFATKSSQPVKWGKFKDISNEVWDLYVVYWDEAQKLLFINCSDTDCAHEALAEAVCGENVALVSGEEIFRAAHGVNRLTLQNVGLKKALYGPISFTLYTGFDVPEGLASSHRRNTFNSNFFGGGYEGGAKTSIGCSAKGKIWAHKRVTVKDLCDWCSRVGAKLLDDTIDVRKVIEGILSPRLITERPAVMPIAIQWPDSFLSASETAVFISFREATVPLYETSLSLVAPAETGPLRFAVTSGKHSAEFELKIFDAPDGKGFQYLTRDGKGVGFRIGSKDRTLADWFKRERPKIWFADGSYVENNLLYKVTNREVSPYNKEMIEIWDWSGVDIRKESQKEAKRRDSVQYHVIQQLKHKDYDVIFDDDDSGEAADVIALKVIGEKILVELYHCKFSGEEFSGARKDDLYVVCGQAQTSIHWKEDVGRLITHMRAREAKRLAGNRPTRFETGGQKALRTIERMVKFYRADFKIFVVQPGLSKSKASPGQLELLGSTELYLQETFNIPLGVIASH